MNNTYIPTTKKSALLKHNCSSKTPNSMESNGCKIILIYRLLKSNDEINKFTKRWDKIKSFKHHHKNKSP